MTTISAGVAVAAYWRTYAPAAPDAPTTAPALTRERAFTAFADAIGSALGPAASGADLASSAPADRVGSVALALKSALENAAGPGDAVGSLLSTVQTALEQAGKALGDAGYSNEQIQSFVTQFRTALSDRLSELASEASSAASTPAGAAAVAATAKPPAPAATAPTPPPAVLPAPAAPAAATPASATPGSGAYAAAYRVTESGAIELVTTSGAVVRIGFRASEGASVLGASASGAAGLAAYAAVSSFTSSQFTISVQGSLSADELKAVNDVLGQVNTLATEFYAGNLTQAFASAATLGVDPREIAGVALSLHETLSLALVGVAAGAPPPTPESAPAAGAAATGADATGATAAPLAGSTASADAAPASGSPPPAAGERGLSSVLDFVGRALAALGTPTTSGGVTLSAKAKLELLAGAIGAATISPAERAAAGALSAVIGATRDVAAG